MDVELFQWLVNQGAGFGIAVFVLWRIDQRMSALVEQVRQLSETLVATANKAG